MSSRSQRKQIYYIGNIRNGSASRDQNSDEKSRSNKKRKRNESFQSTGSNSSESDTQAIGLEEVTVMKLMEEIMEMDQEIQMKQKWINTRVQMLHRLRPSQNKNLKSIIYNFIKRLQPEYPDKIEVQYARPDVAIPMPMDSGEPIVLEMFKGEPIALKSVEMAELDQQAYKEESSQEQIKEMLQKQ
eukprot:403361667